MSPSWAPPPGRRPRGAPRPAASNMADSGVCCGCRFLGGGGGGRVSEPSGARGRSAEPEPSGLGRGGVCVWGRAWGSRGRRPASPPAACGLHPSPVVHCCFRGGGRAAALRGLSPAARALSGAAHSPPGARRAVRRTATAGAVMNGAGRARRRPVTAAGGDWVLKGVGSVPPPPPHTHTHWWRKVDATRGQPEGKPRCQVASERPLARSGSLGAAAPPPAALLIGPGCLHSPQSPPGV